MGVKSFIHKELRADKTFKTFVSKLSTFVSSRGAGRRERGAEGDQKGSRRERNL